MSPISEPRKRVGNPSQKLQKKSYKWMYIALIIIAITVAVVAFVLQQNQLPITENGTPTENPIAVFDTSLGAFKVELFVDKTPITAGNFIDHSNNGYYNGVIFHRVIPNFMIQAGDPLGTGYGGHAAEYHEGYGTSTDPNTWVIPDEFRADLSNVRGTISMANHGENTGGSQFFINVVNNTGLDYNKEPLTSKHAVFGEVIEGMDVVDAISKVKTDNNDKPLQDIIINSITIENP